jgi:HSP20 family protein
MTYTTIPDIYPFRSMLELDKLLGNAARSQSIPKVNMVQNENGSEIRLAVPGLSKQDFEIMLDNNILKIEATKEIAEKNIKDYAILIKEFDYSNFKTEFKISNKVDFKKIDASYNDGILTVFLPYKKEEIFEKSIKIKLKDADSSGSRQSSGKSLKA